MHRCGSRHGHCGADCAARTRSRAWTCSGPATALPGRPPRPRGSSRRARASLVGGVAGALADDLSVGDLVVASEVISGSEPPELPVRAAARRRAAAGRAAGQDRPDRDRRPPGRKGRARGAGRRGSDRRRHGVGAAAARGRGSSVRRGQGDLGHPSAPAGQPADRDRRAGRAAVAAPGRPCAGPVGRRSAPARRC